MNADSENILRCGEVIKHIRMNLHRDNHDRKISQSKLYEICSLIEQKEEQNSRTRAFGPITDLDYGKRKISKIEKGDRNSISIHQMSIIEQAFSLEPRFLLQLFSSFESLKNSYSSTVMKREELPTVESASRFSTIASGFQIVTDYEHVPESRHNTAKAIENWLATEAAGRSSLIFIDGKSGVGKSFFIGSLFKSFLSAKYEKFALSLDLSNSTFDRILPRAIDACLSSTPDRTTDALIEMLNESQDSLLVLDGLKLGHRGTGERIFVDDSGLSLGTLGLVTVYRELLERVSGLRIVLIIENNGRHLNEGPLVRNLPLDVGVVRHTIASLQRIEGEILLEQLSGISLPNGLGAQISDALHGYPLALQVAAGELAVAEPLDRERYLDKLNSDEWKGSTADGSEFGPLFIRYIEQIRTSEFVRGLHPLAAMRLLSLLPTNVSIEQLSFVLEPNRVRRMENVLATAFMEARLPFISSTDNAVHLHAMARRYFRSELSNFVNENNFDDYTDRQELEWIRWRASLWHWRVLRQNADLDEITVDSIEQFTNHILAQIKLIDPSEENRRRKKVATPLSEASIARYEQRPGLLSDGQLWALAYFHAVKPFLLDPRHKPTRIFGQFEAKARILESMTVSALDHESLGGIELANLFKEIAVCWMHAGRLQSALHAIASGVKTLDQQMLKMGIKFSTASSEQLDESHPKSNSAREMWRIYCDVKSAEATIKQRLGRSVEDIADDVEDLSSIGQRAVSGKYVRVNEGSNIQGNPLERGTIRMLGRLADIKMQIGDLDHAKKLFARAEQLQLETRLRGLDGEAARKYVTVLLRHGRDNNETLAMAMNIVEENLERLGAYKGDEVTQSNDIVPFMVIKSAIQRVGQKQTEARNTLNDAFLHRHVRLGYVTFLAKSEMQLERSRHNIFFDDVSDSDTAELLKLRRQAMNAHHILFAHEIGLVLAEILEGAEREKILRDSKTYFRGTGYTFRLEDIGLLQKGRSAIKELGL